MCFCCHEPSAPTKTSVSLGVTSEPAAATAKLNPKTSVVGLPVKVKPLFCSELGIMLTVEPDGGVLWFVFVKLVDVAADPFAPVAPSGPVLPSAPVDP